MHSKLKTLKTKFDSSKVSVHMIFLFTVPLIIVFSDNHFLPLGKLTLLFWTYEFFGATLKSISSLYRERTLDDETIGHWHRTWVKQRDMYNSHFSREKTYFEQLPTWHPDKTTSSRKVSGKQIGEYHIDQLVKIVFVYGTKEYCQFTIMCTPAQERDARKLGDLILCDTFELPTEYMFEVVVIEAHDSLWKLESVLEE